MRTACLSKGIGDTDLRFNIAKLITGVDGNPSRWQNYIVGARSGSNSGSQERNRGRDSDIWGELINHGDGSYTYTFETDVTSAACPAPCTDADGNALDVSYNPALTHRISIQQGNSALPVVNAIYDFVPNGSPVTSQREITKTANCNVCHDKITAHGSRFEIKLCVTCHNPGTWNATGNTTADLPVMIHKIHRGADLPSVVAGGTYAVGSHDFSDVKFPQDIRNCTKCHDGADAETPQGSNWQQPNLAACGSCHDNIDFSADGTVVANGHPGGAAVNNGECVTCHATGRIARSVEESHTIPGKAERAFFKFNLLEICGVAVGSNPTCPPATNPTLKFSVTDPSGATTHQYGNAYNIRSATSTDPEYVAGTAASLNMLIAWDTRDYTNNEGTGSLPSRTASVNLRTSAAVTDNTDGTFTLDGAAAALVIPASATGSGAIALEGRGAANGAAVNVTPVYNVQVPANSEVAYFAITDANVVARRQVVDATTKCDRCHDILSFHGGGRNNNGQLCVMCHNPSGTDIARRPKAASGLPDATAAVDGKGEESIDFKRLIHGIHAAAKTNFDGADTHGFRNQGLVVYGFGNTAHDYSDLRFPGVLSKCETCHLPDTYTLADRSAAGGGNWELPALNGIKGSTVNSHPTAAADGSDFTAKLADQAEDWKISPTAAACSSCHDSVLSMAHMKNNGAINSGAGSEQVVQAGNIESCAVCHGPGKLADVKLVHDEAFARLLGEFIP